MKIISPPRTKFDALTGLRCLLATMVFLYHNRKYWRADIPLWLLRLLNEMHIGVSLFFVLSGFVIAYRYGQQPPCKPKTYCSYALLRICRIYPVYVMIILMAYWDWGLAKNEFLWMNLSLLQGVSAGHNLDGLAQAWSLSVEMCFYLVAPFLLWSLKKYKATWILSLALLPLLAFGIGWLLQQLPAARPFKWLYGWNFILNNTYFGRNYEFLAGIALAYCIQQPKRFSLAFPYCTLIGSVGLLCTMYLLALLAPNIYVHGYNTTLGWIIQALLIPFLGVVFMWGLITEQSLLRRFLSTKLLLLLGNASFVFYLIHISYVNIRIRGWHLFADRNFVLLWLLAVMIYAGIEKPLYDFLKKKIAALG